MDDFLEVVCLGVLESSVPLTNLSDADDLRQTLLRATETSRLLCIVHGVSTTPYGCLMILSSGPESEVFLGQLTCY